MRNRLMMKEAIRNYIEGFLRDYEETNALFGELNGALIDFIHAKAGHAGITPKATTFDQQKLISDWSHRHIAYAAGLGTFGVNNMLLTRHGCYDRFKCYALCRENARIYTEFGSSYTNEDGTGANSVGSEVCGKCVTGFPCAFWTLK